MPGAREFPAGGQARGAAAEDHRSGEAHWETVVDATRSPR
jgi:hypothetical protein